ncbi:hypothetical protein PR202_gb21516 [Eleusine coracana subsp. coracana]|uniref:Saccharopine dehydrogenase-like oxidoreductase n=1 Tax=Eleusine coracana subsp. coracana TaxID=191504 RepID=A0AAV5FEY4_ELECO|nr:hypothetical protein PR202_gb21516 [Eleusine coracana subsp. coracana]
MWATRLHNADTSVVNRTLSTVTKYPEGLPGVEESPEYTEHRKNFWSSIKPAHYGEKITSLKAVVWLLVVGFFISLLGKFSFGRSLLLRYPKFFTLGLFRKSGPTEDEVNSSSFEMWFVGRGFTDAAHTSKHESKTDKEIITKVSGPDIGYITTMITLIQCAITLLSERNNLPKGGVYTPGTIFGPTGLQQRLQENGISFEVLETKDH